ncbi:MAG: hypothetical protein ACXVPN_03405 [Bacteroidia bacterium]
MERIGSIEIRVLGNKGNIKLTPDSYDIKEIISMLQNIENMLYPTNRKERPLITYDIEEGSVRHIFKTGIQAIISFNAVILQVKKTNSIDFLEIRTAQAIESIQKLAYEKNYEFEIQSSLSHKVDLRINPETHYLRMDNIWVEAEFYFYGTLTDAGGKNKANIHIDTDEYGSLTIDTPKAFLENQESNLLYKKYGVRVIGKQNIQTGEIDKSSLTLVELKDFNPKYDDKYINALVKRAKNKWKGIDPNQWLQDLRGGYDA